MSLITIIIPVRNCEKFISETLDILNTLPGLKILLADGNSSDSTINIVNKYIDNGLDIDIISYSDNGQSDALNKLLTHVSTPFFLWLNADDLISKEFITYAVNQIEIIEVFDRDKLVSITSNSIFIDEKSNFVKHQFALKDRSFLVRNGIWFGKFPCRVWNTKLVNNVNGLNKNLFYSMDFDLLRKQYLDNKNLFTIHSDKFMGAFRLHDDSKTGNPLNTPKVQNEMNNLLGRSFAGAVFARILSIFLRILNIKYIFYRFFGNFFHDHRKSDDSI